jgi:hypothetical protein
MFWNIQRRRRVLEKRGDYKLGKTRTLEGELAELFPEDEEGFILREGDLKKQASKKVEEIIK